MMMRNSRPAQPHVRKKAAAAAVPKPAASDEAYRVGPGRPPKEFQFKPGQSGNPRGARRKPRSMVPDLKALLETALSGKVSLVEGERERIQSKAAAGIEQLVNGFAQGDRHARRDLIDMARRLGVDLIGSAARGNNGSPPGSTEDEAVLADYLRRNGKTPDPPTESSSQTTNPALADGETD